MVTYSLKMHSYNVYDEASNLIIARHTGYHLVITDNNGNVTIQAIDFAPDTNNLNKSHVSITESSAEKFIFTNSENPNITQEVYWSSDTTQEYINKYEPYISGELASGIEALEAFNKIKLDAALTNLVNQIDYDFIGDSRVCNTATQYWAEEYIPGYEQEDITTNMSGNYYGKDDDYVNASGYQQAQKINAIRNIVSIIDENNAMDDILTDSEPYISSKYLSILEPVLKQDFRAGGETIPLSDLILGIVQGIIDLGDFNILNEYDKVKTVVKGTISTGETTRSPLTIDLDGDGVETTTVEDGVHFDHDGNNFAEKSSWVGKDDGLLVRDINNNGTIDDGTELFGNNSVLSNGQKASNGFEALKDLDSNNDGVFNSSDTAWSQVKVWKDSNQNGITDAGELLTLEQANISGINLNYTTSNTTDANGNDHSQNSTFLIF